LDKEIITGVLIKLASQMSLSEVNIKNLLDAINQEEQQTS